MMPGCGLLLLLQRSEAPFSRFFSQIAISPSTAATVEPGTTLATLVVTLVTTIATLHPTLARPAATLAS